MSESIDKQALDLVLVGAISKDENIYTDRNERSIGGAVTYGAFSAKRSGSHVGVITKLADKDHHLLDQFGDEQIPVWVLSSKQTTSIRNVYLSSDKESRSCTCLAAVDAFSPENLPNISTKIIHAAALINGEIPLQTLQSMTRIAEVGLDIQGFMRVCRDSKMVLEKPDELAQALNSVTYLKTDASEAEIFTAVTGVSGDEIDKCVGRIVNVQRIIMIGEGRKVPEDDFPLEVNFTEPLKPAGPMIVPGPGDKPTSVAGKMLDRDKFADMLGEYYRLRGWDETGIPLAETLSALGLDDLAIGSERKKTV